MPKMKMITVCTIKTVQNEENNISFPSNFYGNSSIVQN